MSGLQRCLRERRLVRQPTNAAEVASLIKVARRDLADARVEAVSADRRFATAYNAALQLATIIVRAHGYRTLGAGHHFTTLSLLPEILGPDLQSTSDYLNACRAKRNTVDYDGIGVATDSEVAELIEETEKFQAAVIAWVARAHPGLAEGPR